jgi:hypothetical protein
MELSKEINRSNNNFILTAVYVTLEAWKEHFILQNLN